MGRVRRASAAGGSGWDPDRGKTPHPVRPERKIKATDDGVPSGARRSPLLRATPIEKRWVGAGGRARSPRTVPCRTVVSRSALGVALSATDDDPAASALSGPTGASHAMTAPVRSNPVKFLLPDDLDPMRAEALDEAHRFVERLHAEWHAGTMRFDRPGERLLAARVDDILGRNGGPTLDPMVAGAIRKRRFSLRPPLRNRGLDRGLATALIEEPRRTRTLVTVSATHGSAPFWETLGFVPAARGGATTSFPVRPIEIRSEKASRQFPTTPVFGPGLSTRRSRTIARRAGAGTKGRSPDELGWATARGGWSLEHPHQRPARSTGTRSAAGRSRPDTTGGGEQGRGP